MSGVVLLCAISGLSFDSSLLFCLVVLLFVIFLLMIRSPAFYYQKALKHFSSRVRFSCVALVEQLGDDSKWYVQLAAIWHWYLP